MDEQGQKPQKEILSQEPQVKLNAKALQKESLAYKDKYVRLLAEFDNMRKRHDRERSDLIKYAHEEVIVECLQLYDNLERSLLAFKSKEGTDANLIKGLEMVYNNMKEMMGKYEVKPHRISG
jgi:molecular chaperone GrpE